MAYGILPFLKFEKAKFQKRKNVAVGLGVIFPNRKNTVMGVTARNGVLINQSKGVQ